MSLKKDAVELRNPDGLAIECLKIGAKDYLVKPVDTTELVTRLRSLVRSRSTERALQEVHHEYLGFLTEDVLEPLKKIQSRSITWPSSPMMQRRSERKCWQVHVKRQTRSRQS